MEWLQALKTLRFCTVQSFSRLVYCINDWIYQCQEIQYSDVKLLRVTLLLRSPELGIINQLKNFKENWRNLARRSIQRGGLEDACRLSLDKEVVILKWIRLFRFIVILQFFRVEHN